jgi:DNA polymerase-3 subunit gamma/tau
VDAEPSVDAGPPGDAEPRAVDEAVEAPAAVAVTLQQLKDAWPEILDAVKEAKLSAWMVVYTAQLRGLHEEVLTLSFMSENDVASFKQPQGVGEGVSEVLRKAILDILGLRVKFIAKADAPVTDAPPNEDPPPAEPTDSSGWAVAVIPGAADEAAARAKKPSRSATASATATKPKAAEKARYGESVVRELLGANFIEEQPIAPRVTPTRKDD